MKTLSCWQEVIGLLKDVKKKENLLLLQIDRIGEIALNVTDDQQAMHFTKNKGKKIGILRTDIPTREYLVRTLA